MFWMVLDVQVLVSHELIWRNADPWSFAGNFARVSWSRFGPTPAKSSTVSPARSLCISPDHLTRQSVPLHPKSSPNQYCLIVNIVLAYSCYNHVLFWGVSRLILFSFCFSFIAVTPHPWEGISLLADPTPLGQALSPFQLRIWGLTSCRIFLSVRGAGRRNGWQKAKAKMCNGLSPMGMVSRPFWSAPEG